MTDKKRDESLFKWVSEVSGNGIEVTSLMRSAYRDGWSDALSGPSASIADTAKPYERHDPDNATAPFLSFIPDAKRDELIGALLASLERNADRETDFYTVRSFIGGLGLLAAQFAPSPVESIADTAGAMPVAWISTQQLKVLAHNAVAAVSPPGMRDPDDEIPLYVGSVDAAPPAPSVADAAGASDLPTRKKLCTGSHIMCEGREYCLGHPSCSDLAKEFGND